MFVYLLRHATEPRFKVGKAKDIYVRLPGINGAGEFDLAASLCLDVGDEKEALRIEKLIQRLFTKWAHPVNEACRFPGDTEHFHLQCFERLIRFLTENADLTCGTLPVPLPPQPIQPPKAAVVSGVGQASKRADKAAREQRREAEWRANAEGAQDRSLKNMRRLMEFMETGALRCGTWTSPEEVAMDGQRRSSSAVFFALMKDPGGDELSKFIEDELWEIYPIPLRRGYSGGRIFSSSSRYSNGLVIMRYHGADRPLQGDDYQEQAAEMRALLARIPQFQDDDVFSLLRDAKVVEPVEHARVEGLYHRLYRLLLYVHSGQVFCNWERVRDEYALPNWILTYCAQGLADLGVPAKDVEEKFASLRDKAKADLARMQHTVDPMWGYLIYDPPVPLY